jgi:hypothetical protein
MLLFGLKDVTLPIIFPRAYLALDYYQESTRLTPCSKSLFVVLFCELFSVSFCVLCAVLCLCQENDACRCRECARTFVDIYALSQHERVHTWQPRDHVCPTCATGDGGQAFADPAGLAWHRRTVHGEA